MREKTWIIIITIILILGVVVGIALSKKEQPKTNTIVNEVQVNEVSNDISIANEVKENTVENIIENTTEQEELTHTETFSEDPKTEEQKAIDIVKKDYGTADNIEFFIEKAEDGRGRKIVEVIDSETTRVLAYYYVDVQHGTFDKQ